MSKYFEICCQILLFATAVIGDGENRFLSCSQLSSFCMEHGGSVRGIGSSYSPVPAACRTGKAGAKGEKGDAGPPGPAVEIDYDGMERRILSKVRDMIVNCRVVYNESCFVLVGAQGFKYSKADLQRKCERIGGTLANLYSEEHRVQVSQYVRSIMGVYVDVALGMTYSPQASMFRLTSGETVSIQFTWHPGYPKSGENYQNGMLSVQPAASSTTQGVYNYTPYPRSFGLCEYSIPV